LEGLSRGGRRLFLLIQKFIRKYGSFHASQDWIAGNLKVSKRSVKYWTAELVAKKYIVHSYGKQSSATYRIIMQLPEKVAPHWHINWPVEVAPQLPLNCPSIAPQLPLTYKEERFNSLREYNSENNNLTRKPVEIEDATGRLASKNLKSKIAAMVRSSNQMPTRRVPPHARRIAERQ